jgi:hypothetical protein
MYYYYCKCITNINISPEMMGKEMMKFNKDAIIEVSMKKYQFLV